MIWHMTNWLQTKSQILLAQELQTKECNKPIDPLQEYHTTILHTSNKSNWLHLTHQKTNVGFTSQ
jgi:hypothetical protein